MKLQLSTRLILAIFIIQLIMLTILVWNNGRIIYQSHVAQLEQFYLDEQAHLEQTISIGLVYHDRAMLAESIGHLESREDFNFAIVYDRKQRLMASLGKIPEHLNEFKFNISLADALSNKLYVLSADISKEGQALGSIIVGFSTEPTIHIIAQAKHQNILIASVALSLTLLVSILFGRYITANLRLLEQGAKHFSGGNMDYRIPVVNDSAVDKVASAFNELAENLQHTIGVLEEKNRSLNDSEEQVRLLLDSTAEGIFGMDTMGLCTFANRSALELLGYQFPEELIGKDMHLLMHHTHTDGNSYHYEECPSTKVLKTGKGITIDTDLFWCRDGSSFSAEYTTFPIIRHKHIVGLVVNFTDISERKYQQEQIVHQAHFDSLTELPNRLLILDRLSQSLLEAERTQEHVALLFLDLDDFKKVNDSLGHEVGDRILQEASSRLLKLVRKSDTVGRLGGDEFIIILSGIRDIAVVNLIMENLLNCFRSKFVIQKREMILTTSIGIVIYPEDGKSSSELLRNADIAMYHAKEQGRNTYSYFTEAMNTKVQRKLLIEEQMFGALERNEFYLCYQLKVDIASTKVNGMEALLRWNNHELGHISPDEFIPVAEHNGLIVPIGRYVIHQAIKDVAQWNQIMPLKIAINLSPNQFRDSTLVTYIEQILQQYHFPAKQLELEITEGVLMSSHNKIDSTLIQLTKLGIDMALDDFGTGYSSLSYLREYPFKVLKIDRSFIKEMTKKTADLKLVCATINMAHSLDLLVVAEGVETNEQLEILEKHHCDIAQGYLFSKPLPAEDTMTILTNNASPIIYNG